MGIGCSVCRAGTSIAPTNIASSEEQTRMQLAARINREKQAKVPRLELNKNQLYVQRKERNSSRMSSSSVSRAGSEVPS